MAVQVQSKNPPSLGGAGNYAAARARSNAFFVRSPLLIFSTHTSQTYTEPIHSWYFRNIRQHRTFLDVAAPDVYAGQRKTRIYWYSVVFLTQD